MTPIGGNCTAELQLSEKTKNSFGEPIKTWKTIQSLTGYLDFSGGDASYKSNYKGKLEETSHVFICDYVELETKTATPCRMLINNNAYDVLLIDNPMGLNDHLEILLKYNEVIK